MSLSAKTSLLALLLVLCGNAYSQVLCVQRETTVFSFQTKSRKTLSLCKGSNGEYLVYRFGRVGRIELQFPDTLDGSSWGRFEFSGTQRGGAAGNAGFGDYSLAFATEGAGYTVFQEWNYEDATYAIGVIVSGRGEPLVIDGVKATQVGSLVLLAKESARFLNAAVKSQEMKRPGMDSDGAGDVPTAP